MSVKILKPLHCIKTTARPRRAPLPQVIACDVDATLICGGRVNARVVRILREKKAEGFEVIVWSARGTEHAKRACKKAEIENLNPVAIRKPRYIIDDKAWQWTRDTRRIIPAAGKWGRNG